MEAGGESFGGGKRDGLIGKRGGRYVSGAGCWCMNDIGLLLPWR